MANRQLKAEILNLSSTGLNHIEISKVLGCDTRLARYHCDQALRDKMKSRTTARIKDMMLELKQNAGGCCRSCGYNTCSAALQFHHLDRDTKHNYRKKNGAKMNMGDLIQNFPKEIAIEESKKCILLCANCHAEVEAGIRSI